MEPLGSQVAEPERLQIHTDELRLESLENSPSLVRVVKKAPGAVQDLAGGKKKPPPRPSLLLAGEAPGSELVSGEQLPGPWAPVELQVDVRVKSVGAAGSSRAPSPAPSTRFLTVPVPESPASSRHTFPTHPLLQRTPSRPERDLDAEGRASPANGRAEPAGSPTRYSSNCRELGLEKEDALLPGPETDGDQKLPRAIEVMGLPLYMKSLRWALAVMAVFLAVAAVAIVALASRTGATCQLCPPGWMWYEKHCYYLSAEARAWEASQAFCSAHRATLPLLGHIQDFLNRYPVTKYSWVGARRGPQGWHWIDGAPLSPQLLPEENEDKPDLKCGGLEEGKLVAWDCASPRSWVCTKGTK